MFLVPLTRAILIALELLDPREDVKAVLGDPRYAITRFAELSDAPYLRETERFPSRIALSKHVRYWCRIERLAECGMETRLHHYAEYDAIRHHAEQAVSVLCDLEDAQDPAYYVAMRRLALKRVRDTLDPLAWDLGVVP